jgi:hypothetical protein
MGAPAAVPIPLRIVCDVIERLDACSISLSNGFFQELVVQRVLATGKHIDEFTIGEIRQLIGLAREDFNRAYRSVPMENPSDVSLNRSN